MDKVINKHLERMEDLEDRFEDDLDKAMGALDIKELMSDPQGVLVQFALLMKQRLINEYADQSIVEGTRFAKEAETKTIEVKI